MLSFLASTHSLSEVLEVPFILQFLENFDFLLRVGPAYDRWEIRTRAKSVRAVGGILAFGAQRLDLRMISVLGICADAGAWMVEAVAAYTTAIPREGDT